MAALAGVIAHALLPGLLVVRAPWTAVPALSLAFWAVSAWWPPLASAHGRGAALAAFALLASLRLLPKHEVAPPPGWTPSLPARPAPAPRPGLPPPRLSNPASLLLLAASLALVVPSALWQHAPGPALAFQTTSARLVVWRGAMPLSLEPLLPLAPAGAHAPAIASLAADAGRFGADPAHAVVALLAASAALCAIGLFALLALGARPTTAALGALVGLALSPWPGWVAPLGAGEALLALGFLLPGAALACGHVSRSSAFASGLLLAAGALAQPVLACASALGCAAVTGRRDGRAGLRRGATIALSALVLATPGLLPLARALSGAEAAAALSSFPVGVGGLALGLFALVLSPLLASTVVARNPRRARIVAALAALLLVLRVHRWIGSEQLPAESLRVLRELSTRTQPLEVVCAPGGRGDWVPALAGRPVEPLGFTPPVYSDERARADPRPCAASFSLP